MSSKRLGGLDKKLGSKRLNVGGTAGKLAPLAAASAGGPNPLMFSADVLGARAGETGTSSAARDERLAGESAAELERQRVAGIEAEAAAKQREIDEQNERDKAARDKLREAQGGGYAANILSRSRSAGRSRSLLSGS